MNRADRGDDVFDYPLFESAERVVRKFELRGDSSDAVRFLRRRLEIDLPNKEVKNSYVEALFTTWKFKGDGIARKDFTDEEKRRRYLKKVLTWRAKDIRESGELRSESNAERIDYKSARTGKQQYQSQTNEEEAHARLKAGRSSTGYVVTSVTHIPYNDNAEKRERKHWWPSSRTTRRNIDASALSGENLLSTVHRKPVKRKGKKRAEASPEGKTEAGSMIKRAELTPREKEVWDLMADDWDNENIARVLKMSEATVRVHRANIRKKYGVL